MNKLNRITKIILPSIVCLLLIAIFSCDAFLESVSLNLTASTDREDRIDLSWSQPTVADNNNDGYPDATVINYSIYRDSIPQSTTSSLSYTDIVGIDISADAPYSYYVVANLSNLDHITSLDATGYAIRKSNAHLYSTIAKATADPVITNTGLGQSTWHQVYLMKGWTYHFRAESYNSSTPVFSQFSVYSQNQITGGLNIIDTSGPNFVEGAYISSTSGYYWIRVEANDDFQFYAWYD